MPKSPKSPKVSWMPEFMDVLVGHLGINTSSDASHVKNSKKKRSRFQNEGFAIAQHKDGTSARWKEQGSRRKGSQVASEDWLKAHKLRVAIYAYSDEGWGSQFNYCSECSIFL